MSRLDFLFRLLVVLLVGKTVLAALQSYPNYFPPDFRSDFLRGREAYFDGAYAGAFYAHIVSGPLSLMVGLLLLSERFRRWHPAWHRRLGRFQALVVLVLVAPSGLWMAAYAASGRVAGAGLAVLAVATGWTVALGWRAAVSRRFADHRLWMTRCYALLFSAVVLRAIGGASEVLGTEWTYPIATWLSWIAPLAALEGWRLTSRIPRSPRRQQR